MHPHERLRALLAGTGCTVCGGSLEASRIRVLAEREDLAFVELPCLACGSTALGIVAGPRSAEPQVDISGPGELTAADAIRFAGAPPIGAADVAAMRELLRAHQGGLLSLLGARPDGPAGPGTAPGERR